MDANRTYSLPTEIDSEMRIRSVPVVTIIAALAGLFFAQKFEMFIYEDLKTAWYVFNILVGIILTMKTRRNGNKRLIQSIFIVMSNKKRTYKPIDNPLKYEEMQVSKKDETPDEEYQYSR